MTPSRTATATLLVRNEADRLATALGSLRAIPSIAELLLLDTGSSDDTLAIARAFGCVIHEAPWANDFSAHRNALAELASNDLLVVLDGDEEILDPGDLDEQLRHSDGDGLFVEVQCVSASGRIEECHHSVRAYDRRKGRWRYAIHNQLVGLEDCRPSTAVVRAWYDDDVHTTARARLDVMLEHAAHAPEDPHWLYHITHAHRVLGQVDEMSTWARRYLETVRFEEARGAVVVVWLVQAALAQGKMPEAMQWMGAGLQHFPRYPDLLHLQLTISTQVFYRSSRELDPRYLGVPTYTRQAARQVPAAARLLELPLAFDSPAAVS